jgi:hypothetical protein
MTDEQIVAKINEMFPPSDPDHPICFLQDGLVVVTGERYYKASYNGEDFECPAIDYYGEFSGGYPYINGKLNEYVEKLGLYWEWQSPAAIVLCK